MWLRSAGLLAAGGLFSGPNAGISAQQDSLSGEGATGTLRDPYSVGRPRDRATDADNDETIKNIEHKLKCSCGCNLDIFTCRTTDFTCTISPRLHQQVVGLYRGGSSEEQILQQFVDEYGEQALMAPRPEGFNIVGYVVPGIVIAIIGTSLAWYLGRRRQVVRATETASGEQQAQVVSATPEELARIRSDITRDD
ncbi:MAG: cytochrome c-type biogenesis protein CcmH [Gemmatimonadota bacterium]